MTVTPNTLALTGKGSSSSGQTGSTESTPVTGTTRAQRQGSSASPAGTYRHSLNHERTHTFSAEFLLDHASLRL